LGAELNASSKIKHQIVNKSISEWVKREKLNVKVCGTDFFAGKLSTDRQFQISNLK
jgi:hypothetical protein